MYFSSERVYEWPGSNQRFSITGFRIILKRHYSKYLYIYYLPSTLFVITSWVSFLIPPEVVPGRMALLVTLFLVLINIFNNVTAITPNTEGMTAISSWMLGKHRKLIRIKKKIFVLSQPAFSFYLEPSCHTPSFFTFYFNRNSKNRMPRGDIEKSKGPEIFSLFREGLHIIYSKDCKVHPPPEIKQRLEDLDEIERCQKMSTIDAIFLRLFPLSFLVFNLIYWPYWVMMPDENEDKLF